MKKVNIQMSAKVRLFLQLVCCLSIITNGTGGCSKIASNSNDSYSCTLGPANEIDQSWLPWPQYYPDGGFSIIEIDSSFAIFWPEFESSRSVGNSPFPENHNGTNLLRYLVAESRIMEFQMDLMMAAHGYMVCILLAGRL